MRHPDHAALPIKNVALILTADAEQRIEGDAIDREDYRAPRCNDAPELGLRCIRAAGHGGTHANAEGK